MSSIEKRGRRKTLVEIESVLREEIDKLNARHTSIAGAPAQEEEVTEELEKKARELEEAQGTLRQNAQSGSRQTGRRDKAQRSSAPVGGSKGTARASHQSRSDDAPARHAAGHSETGLHTVSNILPRRPRHCASTVSITRRGSSSSRNAR
jgi:hypothetical protein